MNDPQGYSQVLRLFNRRVEDARWLRAAEDDERFALAVYLVKRDTDEVAA